MMNSWKKFAITGIAGMLLSSVPALAHSNDLNGGFEDTPQVKSAMSAVQEQVKFIEEFGITKGLNYTLTFDIPVTPDREAVSAANVFNENSCDVTVGLNQDGASSLTSPEFRGEIDGVLSYSENEKIMMARAFAGHEIAHCRLVKIQNPFQLENPESSKIVNEVYGNTLTRGVIKVDGVDKINFGLGDFLNESYADGMAFATMIKSSNGSADISDFFNKVSANRDLQTLKMNELGIMSTQQVDAYDLKMATKGLNNPDNITKILDAKTPQELDAIVLDNANKNVFKSLSSRSIEDLQSSIGIPSLHQQAVNYSVFSDKHLDPNSLTSQAIQYGVSKLSPEDKELREASIKIMSSSNFSKMPQAIKDLTEIRTKLDAPISDFLNDKKPLIDSAIDTIYKEAQKHKYEPVSLATAKKDYASDFGSINFVTSIKLDVENSRNEYFSEEKPKISVGVKLK